MSIKVLVVPAETAWCSYWKRLPPRVWHFFMFRFGNSI